MRPARLTRFTFCGLLCLTFGCGKIPLLSENRKDFPPWERLPEGNGIRYVERFTHDPGTDPLYLAKMTYEDDAALQKVIDTFGLVPHSGPAEPPTFTTTSDRVPEWFPLANVTDVYVFPAGKQDVDGPAIRMLTDRGLLDDPLGWKPAAIP